MVATVRVYDGDLQELLKRLDRRAREIDGAKYGLPPRDRELESIVYRWLFEKDLTKKED